MSRKKKAPLATTQFIMRMSVEERERLEFLANHYGARNLSELIRMFQFIMRMSVEERERLEFLANHYGARNLSELIRMLLKKEIDALAKGRAL